MVTVMKEDSIMVGGAEVVSKRNGHLHCEEDRTYWCKHIQHAVTEHLDIVFIWPKDYDGESMKIEVPMVPSANQWASVMLEPANLATPTFEVVLETAALPSPDPLFLGFLHPGEGRAILRSMVFDWFRGSEFIENLECKARSHGYKQQVKWEEDMKNPVTSMAQYWSVWRDRTCLGCSFTTDGIDDLVPDAGPSTSPWTKAT